MTLGKPGVRGNPPEALTDPNDVVTDPENGDVYVAESHTNVEDPKLIGRISVFDKNGKFLRTIGKTGTGPGEFRTPHSVKFDSQGRLIVADRHNHRVQILTKDGKFVGKKVQPASARVGHDDFIYAATQVEPRRHPGLSGAFAAAA
jgi:DNA-binding beta-propeller fold protein YncE